VVPVGGVEIRAWDPLQRELLEGHGGGLGELRGWTCSPGRDCPRENERSIDGNVAWVSGQCEVHGIRAQAEGDVGLVLWNCFWRVHNKSVATLSAPMETKRNRMESSELLRKLKDAIQLKADTVPEGYKTVKDWAKAWSLSRAHAEKLLKIGVESGVVDSKQFRIPIDGRKTYPVYHYREIPQ